VYLKPRESAYASGSRFHGLDQLADYVVDRAVTRLSFFLYGYAFPSIRNRGYALREARDCKAAWTDQLIESTREWFVHLANQLATCCTARFIRQAVGEP